MPPPRSGKANILHFKTQSLYKGGQLSQYNLLPKIAQIQQTTKDSIRLEWRMQTPVTPVSTAADIRQHRMKVS